MLSTDQLFFDQQRPRRFQHRRLRKIDDTLSNFGDKKESYLTFTKSNWDAESVQTGVRSLKRPPTAGRRPSTASRRVSVNEIPTLLPPIDPSGPRLVSKEPLIPEEVEVRSTLSNKKREFLEEVEGKLQSREKDKPSRYWKFNEAKFVSISVLARLSELIYSSEFEVTLPESLVEDLRRSHQELTADVIVEKREWQTDCYLDYKKKNEQPFLTSLPEEPQAQAKLEAAVEKVAKKEIEKEKVKKVRMSREISKRKTASPERPQTARSILSSYSFKSDATGESATDDDGRESRMEYDVLPADLSSRLMNFRQESLVPKLRRSAAKTRLEKFQMQKKVIEKKKKPKAVNLSSGKPFDGNEERKKEDKADDGTGGGGPIVGHTTINFSMTKTDFYDEGWVVVPSDSRDPEANTLRMWQRKLREFAIKRDEEKLVAKQQGVDGPLVVKFFNDPRMKTLRSKHQRSATFPLPAVFSKLPPGSMTGFSSQPTQEAKLIGEGLTVFVLILPDGSGYCNYLSGRQAVCLSRRTEGVKGFYTTVFDDVEGRSLLAYFTPTGKACCYYPSGAIHMLCDREGGSLYSEVEWLTACTSEPDPEVILVTPVEGNLFTGKGCIRELDRACLWQWLSSPPVTKKVKSIVDGKRHSWRHNIFCYGIPKKREGLKWQSFPLLTGEQVHVVTDFLAQKFCNEELRMKLFAYANEVILPELLISLVIDFYNLGYDEAEKKLITPPGGSEPAAESTSLPPVKFAKEEILTSKKVFIGSGTYGAVYKDVHLTTGEPVAIKVLHKQSMCDLLAFKHHLSGFNHPNLMPFIGYCEKPTALVFPYMEGLSLFHRLHQATVDSHLLWKERVHILLGTARGLKCLHPTFPHYNMKSQNILLDKNLNAKVADFGYHIPLPKQIGSTSIISTVDVSAMVKCRGYLPSEFGEGIMGAETDVYAYGIVCLEVFTGLYAYSEDREENNLYDHCKELDMWKNESSFTSIADAHAKGNILANTVVQSFMIVSRRCTERNYKKRCAIEEVIQAWERCTVLSQRDTQSVE